MLKHPTDNAPWGVFLFDTSILDVQLFVFNSGNFQ